jgi:streptogramin lyase
VALDLHGNVWVSNFSAIRGVYSFSEVASNGTVLLNKQSTGNLGSPGGAAVDAGGQFWIANYTGNSITEIAGNDAPVAAGTALSPAGFGQDAGLFLPFSLALDQSGNVWVSNQAGNSLTMFFGLATPTATPMAPTPHAP